MAPGGVGALVRAGERHRPSRELPRLAGVLAKGLIDQLEYEGCSTSGATYALDSISVDWNEQAPLNPAQYLDSQELLALRADGSDAVRGLHPGPSQLRRERGLLGPSHQRARPRRPPRLLLVRNRRSRRRSPCPPRRRRVQSAVPRQNGSWSGRAARRISRPGNRRRLQDDPPATATHRHASPNHGESSGSACWPTRVSSPRTHARHTTPADMADVLGPGAGAIARPARGVQASSVYPGASTIALPPPRRVGSAAARTRPLPRNSMPVTAPISGVVENGWRY